MYKSASERYKKIDGKETIQIRVNSVLQLFDARDPAPFRDRDIDDDFTEYIVTSAEEIPLNTPFRISIQVAQRSEISPDAVTEAIQTYFQYQIELKRLQLAKMRRMAQLFLLIGLVLLVLCLAVARTVETWESVFFSRTVREGILIIGWVSLWRPLELLMFDWYPIYDRIRTYRKILRTEIQVNFVPESSTGQLMRV
jgi:hypothetical protein